MRARDTVLGVLALVLAGCLSSGPGALVEPQAEDAADVPATLEAPTFRAPVRLGGGGTAAEPNLLVTGAGEIFVATHPFLWRSTDGGATFEALGEEACGSQLAPGVCAPGAAERHAPLEGSGDGDLASDAAGNLYWVGLNGRTGTVPFQVSRDRGETWSAPVDLADGNTSDRQWILALSDGTLFVTWRDFGAPDAEDAPERLLVRRSLDGGARWDAAVAIAEDALQGPLARDARSGALYTPFYDDGMRIARSTDGGATWSVHEVTPGGRDLSLRQGNPIGIFPVAAVDDAGAVYVVWSEDDPATAPKGLKHISRPRVLLASSTDGGESWSDPFPISTEGRAAVLPWIVAGKAGRVAVAWYENRAGLPNEHAPDLWDVVLVESVDAASPSPTFMGGRANRDPVHVGAICTDGGRCDNVCTLGECARTRACLYSYACAGRDRSRLDFFELDLGRDGHPLVTWVADADPRAGRGVQVHVGGVERGTPLR